MTDDEFMEKARALTSELNLHIGFSNSRSEHLMDTAVDVIATALRSAVERARAALAEAERVKGETSDTSDTVAELRAWGPLVSSGYECPAAGTTMHRAADIIERLERELAEARGAKTALYKLVRKGTDGRWYTTQHGDSDVTALMPRKDTPDGRD